MAGEEDEADTAAAQKSRGEHAAKFNTVHPHSARPVEYKAREGNGYDFMKHPPDATASDWREPSESTGTSMTKLPVDDKGNVKVPKLFYGCPIAKEPSDLLTSNV